MAQIQIQIELTELNQSGPYYNAYWSDDCVNWYAVLENPIYLPTIGSTAQVTVDDSYNSIKLVSIGLCTNEIISGSCTTSTTTVSPTTSTTTTSTTTTQAPSTTTTTTTTAFCTEWDLFCPSNASGNCTFLVDCCDGSKTQYSLPPDSSAVACVLGTGTVIVQTLSGTATEISPASPCGTLCGDVPTTTSTTTTAAPTTSTTTLVPTTSTTTAACYNCNDGYVYESTSDTAYGTYPDKDICAGSNECFSISWDSVDRPNRFTIYDDSGLIWTSGWVGYANYSGPWGASLNTPTSGNSGIQKFGTTTGRYMRVEYGPADPLNPQGDAASWYMTCQTCPYYYYSGLLCGGSIQEYFRSTDPALPDHCQVVYAWCTTCGGGSYQCFDNISYSLVVNTNDVVQCYDSCVECGGTTTTSTTQPPVTTTTTTCACFEYELFCPSSAVGGSCTFDYTDCNGTPQTAILVPDSNEYQCACDGSVSVASVSGIYYKGASC